MTKSVLVPDVGLLANYIREIDGNNKMGAAMLAELICDWLEAAPKAVDEPVGYLDLSKKKITENPYFTVGPVSDSKGWLPVYASPQKSEPELMFDEARIVISSLHQDASIKSYQYMESSLSHRAQRVLAWLNDRTKQPPEQPE